VNRFLFFFFMCNSRKLELIKRHVIQDKIDIARS